MSEDQTRPLRVVPRPPEVRELAIGDSVGAWKIDAMLGAGGFAIVYRARRADGVRAAVKVMHAKLATSPDLVARFEREIDVLRRLEHTNIVQIIDAGFDREGRPYLAMELLEGNELGSLIKTEGPFEPALAVAVTAAICGALTAAHALGIVHRDVKATNIFVCSPRPGETIGRVVLLDFGIAKLSDALAPELTASHQSIGTPTSMAPEQIRGATVDGRTDVYALGCLLFQMLTCQLPFVDESPVMTQYLHLHARRPRPSVVSNTPAPFDEVIARSMAIEPSARFADAHAMMTATRAALQQPALDVAREQIAILVSTGDSDQELDLTSDEAVVVDLESVIPLAEQFLGNLGFSLAVDLGSSAVFVAPADRFADPTEPATGLWDHLERRPRAQRRVAIGICAHRGTDPATLLRPSTWRVDDPSIGLWLTHALDPAAARGRRVR